MIEFLPSREIALTIGPLSVHWYGVMYAVAFLVGLFLMKRLLPLRGLALSKEQIDRLFVWIVLGVLLGGRLGFVLLYGGMEYLTDPIRILKVWEGGMSSHGGFIGVTIALILFTRREKIALLGLVDTLVPPIALGLMFGRIGNFINGELYGTLTTLPWGMHFPHAEGLRHPTQLYAVMKDLFIATACFLHLRATRQDFVAGQTTALFLMLYGILRFIVEHFRDQPYAGFSFGELTLTRGQLYTVPVFVTGLIVFLWTRSSRRKTL